MSRIILILAMSLPSSEFLKSKESAFEARFYPDPDLPNYHDLQVQCRVGDEMVITTTDRGMLIDCIPAVPLRHIPWAWLR